MPLKRSDSKTSTRAVSENASVVRTLFGLFFRYAVASLKEVVSVRPSVHRSVRPMLFSKIKRTRTRRILCRVSGLVSICSSSAARQEPNHLVSSALLQSDLKKAILAHLKIHDSTKRREKSEPLLTSEWTQ